VARNRAHWPGIAPSLIGWEISGRDHAVTELGHAFDSTGGFDGHGELSRTLLAGVDSGERGHRPVPDNEQVGAVDGHAVQGVQDARQRVGQGRQAG
jgi:hypothetical protein